MKQHLLTRQEQGFLLFLLALLITGGIVNHIRKTGDWKPAPNHELYVQPEIRKRSR